MQGPGRQSAASLSVAPAAPWARLDPPEHLTESQRKLWVAVVATKPAEWFKADSAPVLEAYCQAVDNYRRTQQALDETQALDLAQYKTLSELSAKQASLVSSLATKLRLTPQSRYTPDKAAVHDRKTGTEARRPWDRK
jgi:phage terminase small subunit